AGTAGAILRHDPQTFPPPRLPQPPLPRVYSSPTYPVPAWPPASCALEVRAREDSSCARFADGSIWCWGEPQTKSNSVYAPKYVAADRMVEANAVELALPGQGVARLGDGTVWCWGGRYGAGPPSGGSNCDGQI